MKQPAVLLIVIGSILVILPVFLGLFVHDEASFQENYQKAMERMRQTQPSYGDQFRHNEALRQAGELRTSRMGGTLAQIVGFGMIVVGVVRTRFHTVVVPTGVSEKTSRTTEVSA